MELKKVASMAHTHFQLTAQQCITFYRCQFLTLHLPVMRENDEDVQVSKLLVVYYECGSKWVTKEVILDTK